MPDVVLVDTDVFSFLWQGRPEADPFRPHLDDRVLALSFTSLGEVYYGAHKRGWGASKMQALEGAVSPYLVLPYDREMSKRWGALRAELDDVGQSVSMNDLWIAVTALHYEITLATNNRRDFERIPGLQLVP